jgi:hypothetical protein
MAILGVNPANPSGVTSGFSVSFCMVDGGFQRSAKYADATSVGRLSTRRRFSTSREIKNRKVRRKIAKDVTEG